MIYIIKYISQILFEGNIMTKIAKVFQNGRSQAIRIPKEYKVDTNEVFITKVGDSLIIKPKYKNKWDRLFDILDTDETKDFLTNRVQLPLQVKEIF